MGVSKRPVLTKKQQYTLFYKNSFVRTSRKGVSNFREKIRGLKFLGENLRGLKSNSKFDQNFFKISIFLKVTDQNIAKIVKISEIRKADEVKVTNSETPPLKRVFFE